MGAIQKLPALCAFLIQVLAGCLVLASCWLLVNVSAYFSIMVTSIPVVIVVLMQAIVSASISHYLAMAPWWRIIHFSFPIVVWLMLMADVPNEIYLVGFLLTLSIFWTTFRTQVPYYPSRLDVWQTMHTITENLQKTLNTPVKVIDIGSGLGGLSLYLARHQKNIHIEGIEIAPLPWLVSRLRAWLQRSAAVFTLGNYHALNFANYDIVFAYLSPAAMPALWEKARHEMRSGTLLVSLEFEIPTLNPIQTIIQKGQSRALFVYKII